MSREDKNFLRQQYVANKKGIIGIDIGSRFHYFQYQSSDFKSEPIRIDNNKKGFLKLHSYIQELDVSPEEVIVGIESTGSYWAPLTNFLESLGYEWVFVNPLHTRRYTQIQHNSPLKTDATDTSVIISLIKSGHYLKHPLREGAYQDLYNLSRLRHQIVHDRTKTYNHLHSILAEYFPELISIFKTGTSKTLLRLLKTYPTPRMVIEGGYDKVYQAISVKVSKKWAEKKAQAIVEAAKQSIGIIKGEESYKSHILVFILQIELFNQQLKEIEEKIHTTLQSIPEARLLFSISGLSDYSIAVILGYLGNIHNYNNVQEAIKYAGLNLYERSSGTKKGTKHISKRGPGILRHVLYLSALNLIRSNSYVKEKYQRYIKNKKNKLKSIIPIMHYIIKVIFAVIKNQKEYDANYHLTCNKKTA